MFIYCFLVVSGLAGSTPLNVCWSPQHPLSCLPLDRKHWFLNSLNTSFAFALNILWIGTVCIRYDSLQSDSKPQLEELHGVVIVIDETVSKRSEIPLIFLDYDWYNRKAE